MGTGSCLPLYSHPKPPNSTQLDKINPDIVRDPTLARDAGALCPRCEERDPSPDAVRYGAVFFQAPATFSSEERMSLILGCCNPECLYKWLQ